MDRRLKGIAFFARDKRRMGFVPGVKKKRLDKPFQGFDLREGIKKLDADFIYSANLNHRAAV